MQNMITSVASLSCDRYRMFAEKMCDHYLCVLLLASPATNNRISVPIYYVQLFAMSCLFSMVFRSDVKRLDATINASIMPAFLQLDSKKPPTS